MARILKTPAAPIVTTSLILLIPGGSLYYTMSSAFESDFAMFLEKAVSTLKLACALALGIIVVTAISQFLFRRIKQRKIVYFSIPVTLHSKVTGILHPNENLTQILQNFSS